MSDAPHTPRDGQVAGRAMESARIDAWLATVPHGVRALLIHGEPGIGKTTLWRHALDGWRAAGHAVLAARPAEEELPLALCGLLDLFERVIPDLSALSAQDDPIRRGRLVLDSIRTVAAAQPVLIAIDDLQWLDAASARALRYALRRLDTEPVGVLATVRAGGTARDPLELPGLLPPGRVQTVDVGPMDLVSLRQALGGIVTTISPQALRHVHEVSVGNPMFARELARGLTGSGTGRTVLRMPDSLRTAIRQRLEIAPASLMPLLETVSAMGRASVTQLRTLVEHADVDKMLAVAEQHGLLTVDGDLVARFAHPIVGTVVHEEMRPLARCALHGRLAQFVDDPDLRARHLALAAEAPDAAVADVLEQAAARVYEHGALGVAADFGEHVVRLTPSDDGDAVQRRTLQLIRYRAAAGDAGRALVLADQLVARLPPGPRRAEALVERAQLEDDDLETGEALLERALDEPADDVALRGRVLDQLGWLCGVFRGDLSRGIAYGREALDIAQRCGDDAFEMSAAAGLSNMETLAGTPRPDLMARAVELEDEIGRPPLWAGPRVLHAEQLLWAGDLPAARALLEAAVAHAEHRNQERWRPYSLYDLAAVEGAAGNLHRADQLLAQAIEVARDCEDTHVESWVFYRLALIATWLGRADEARAAAGRRIAQAARRGERPGIARARSVLGLLALSEGDPRAAATELVASVDLLEQMGFRHPGAIPALPDAIEALALAGDDVLARTLLERLTGQVARVGSRWADAALQRARGTVALANGAAEAATLLGDAEAAFDALGCKPDAARATLLRGRACLRAGQRTSAADAFERSRTAFMAIGARLWARRAEDELDRVAPGRTSGELTAAERQIATLVAGGRTNREIAQALFMSVATVEAHLTRTYRKLGIRSRSELTRLVTEGTVAVRGAADRPQGHP
ncbi:AAA family ATPase [Dactylosporangium sp. AC04546]|uniref:AAA family ATPase n=1 Tax=Dactylosporangium sp. AC04546 TaxID=2862460 RepID=UPI001EDF0F9B|nr:LuxR family transcriptional regulator [Dactylosporangium sp. AC04546]WVK81830.1 AAA family ATPase [Dactylosporangium sp. AC04546]